MSATGTRWLWCAVLAVVATPGLSQSCPCSLSNSTSYSGMFVWDCLRLSLTEVPGDCLVQQSENVAELLMSYNTLTSIRSTTLALLTDLRQLYLDNNYISFFDPTALEFMRDLEVFNANHNLDLELEYETFAGLNNIREITTIGTSLQVVPDISHMQQLERVDMRSSYIAGLPTTTFVHPNITSPSFYMNFHGNLFSEVAAIALLGLPDGTLLNLDTNVIVWAKDTTEKSNLLAKTWTINIDLATSTRICGVDGSPTDVNICSA